MPFDNLLVERDAADARVALITINRPQVLNALNRATLDELRRAVLDLRYDEGVRAAIITGAGPKAFAAGADINEFLGLSAAAARELALAGQHVFDLIENLGKPVIAAINGFALGGGCELAMACTLRVAADTAQLGQPEINLGLLPGYGGTQRLPRLVGRGRALDIMMTGTALTAAEAERIGLVNRVVSASDLLSYARTLARLLASKAPVAIGYILDAVNTGDDMPFAAGAVHEASLFGLAAATDDMREGVRAFLEKRTPQFKGQ